jgi:hypothetical protein
MHFNVLVLLVRLKRAHVLSLVGSSYISPPQVVSLQPCSENQFLLFGYSILLNCLPGDTIFSHYITMIIVL